MWNGAGEPVIADLKSDPSSVGAILQFVTLSANYTLVAKPNK
ncbi:hypothetical protein ABIF50_006821 [Bradyrhizobium diazoefficiens]